MKKVQYKMDRYSKARNKVEKLRGFYVHLIAYIAVNMVVSTLKIWRNLDRGETFEEAFLDFSTFAVWLFWGVGLALHAFSIFVLPRILNEYWEERQIRKYMEEEQHNKWE